MFVYEGTVTIKVSNFRENTVEEAFQRLLETWQPHIYGDGEIRISGMEDDMVASITAEFHAGAVEKVVTEREVLEVFLDRKNEK